ncbi:MAG: LCP family protein, partial [Actinomycetia bacterium]|nr:LCP family protein [Actinomycetes bacterium]
MKRLNPTVPALVALLLFATACTSTPNAEPEVAPVPTTASPTTTTQTPEPTTTSQAPTTTSTEPIETVTIDGDLPDGLLTAITTLLSWQRDERNETPTLPEGLTEHLAATPLKTSDTVSVTGTTASIEGGQIAVIETDAGEVLLAADEGDGWQIVGADPAAGPPWYGEEPRMVMVIGSDARPGENQQRLRADSIHLLTANPSEGNGTILGFPRDSWVSTPYGSMKFTSLMAGRGPQVMVDKVVDTWDLPVEGYVVTGFKGFEDLMRNLGSLPIDLPRAIPTQAWWEGFGAGSQRLSPQRTLEYARTRKGIPGGDFTRSANQGVVMLAVLRLLQMNDITDAPEIVSVLLDHAWTSLTPTDLIQLAATVHVLDVEEIENVVLPGTLGRAGLASVVRLTPEADEMLADLGDDG